MGVKPPCPPCPPGPPGPQGIPGPAGPGTDPATRFQVSGLFGGGAVATIPSNSTIALQAIAVRIQQGNRLVIKRTRFRFNDVNHRLNIQTNPFEQEYVSLSNFDEETPNLTIFTNNSTSPILIILGFNVRNPSNTEDSTLLGTDGWWVDFAIE